MYFPGVLLPAERAEELRDLQQQSVVLTAPRSPGSCGASAGSSAESSVERSPARCPAERCSPPARLPLQVCPRRVEMRRIISFPVDKLFSCRNCQDPRSEPSNLLFAKGHRAAAAFPAENTYGTSMTGGPAAAHSAQNPLPAGADPGATWPRRGRSVAIMIRWVGPGRLLPPPSQHPGCPSESDLPQSPPA